MPTCRPLPSAFAFALAFVLTPSRSHAAPPGDPPSNADPPPRVEPLRIDPILDGTVLTLSVGFAGINGAILASGELRPARPGSVDNLLAIDRFAVRQTFDPSATTSSNLALYSAFAFAAVDPVLTGFRDGPAAALHDAVIYGESLAIASSFAGLVKIAVRRPRPSTYRAQAILDASGQEGNPAATDDVLSFYSGHSSTVAAASATATYLAFLRSPGTVRPLVTLVAGLFLTTFVSIERVRAGAHFPTDVIAGALSGGAIGILVPHLHRYEDKPRRAALGCGPAGAPLGLSLSGSF